jgi:hypothetical protein
MKTMLGLLFDFRAKLILCEAIIETAPTLSFFRKLRRVYLCVLIDDILHLLSISNLPIRVVIPAKAGIQERNDFGGFPLSRE